MGIKLTELITQLTTWYARRDNPNQVTKLGNTTL